jgi:hypothetical protein
MRTFNTLPQHKTIVYDLNQQLGYYTKSATQPERYPFMRLPFELKIAPTQSDNIKFNAKELLHSKEKNRNGNYKFVTGLQPLHYQNWYVGNDYEMLNGNKVTSMVITYITHDRNYLVVYYFARFDKPNAEQRKVFANQIVPHLIKNG